jgi:hypothetical protein
VLASRSMIRARANVSHKMELSFPVLRYHPPMKLGGGKTSSFQIYDAPLPVRDNWAAIKLSLSGQRLAYLQSAEKGTDGSGLFRSPEWLTYSEVVPGGLLDSRGQHVPILNYWRTDRSGNGAIRFLASFVTIFGVRYQHKFEFGDVEILDLDAYKKKFRAMLRKQNALRIPKNDVDNATSYVDIMRTFTIPKRLERFSRDYEVDQTHLMS